MTDLIFLGEFYNDYDDKPDKYNETLLAKYYFDSATGKIRSVTVHTMIGEVNNVKSKVEKI